jgi:hypothetical protein
MKDTEYATRLEALAVRALRKNQARTYQMSWAEAVHLMNSDELHYVSAAAPSVVLRLLRRLRRLEAQHG